MKRTAVWVLGFGLLASLLLALLLSPGNYSGIATTAFAQEQTEDNGDNGCTDASLNGTFGFRRQGTTGVGTPQQAPLAAVGIITIANGSIIGGHQTISRNGVFTDTLIAGGTYHVDADCTGSLFLQDGTLAAHFSIVDRGNEVFALSLRPGNAVVEVWKKLMPGDKQ